MATVAEPHERITVLLRSQDLTTHYDVLDVRCHLAPYACARMHARPSPLRWAFTANNGQWRLMLVARRVCCSMRVRLYVLVPCTLLPSCWLLADCLGLVIGVTAPYCSHNAGAYTARSSVQVHVIKRRVAGTRLRCVCVHLRPCRAVVLSCIVMPWAGSSRCWCGHHTAGLPQPVPPGKAYARQRSRPFWLGQRVKRRRRFWLG